MSEVRLTYSTLPETEIGWDLTIFNQPSHDFSKFVDTLQRDRKNMLLAKRRNWSPPPSFIPIEYSSTLAYVRFPNLGPCKPGSAPRREVLEVLLWLRNLKSVTEIVSLHVPDCITDPHSDSAIRTALGFFHYDPLSDSLDEAEGISIKDLDWRKYDLSADILLERAHLVEKLVLYSSGNWAVIDHWFGSNGLPLLGRLKRVTLAIVKVYHMQGS